VKHEVMARGGETSMETSMHRCFSFSSQSCMVSWPSVLLIGN